MGDAQENRGEEKKNVMGDSVPQGGPQQVLGGLKSKCCFRSPSPALHRIPYQDGQLQTKQCNVQIIWVMHKRIEEKKRRMW